MSGRSPTFPGRVARAYREEGLSGVTQRIRPAMKRMIGAARLRAWRRHDAPITAVFMAAQPARPAAVAAVLLKNRGRGWSRWLAEILIVGPIRPAEEESLFFARGVPVRYFSLIDDNPAQAANTSVALAHAKAVMFCDETTPPLTSAVLSKTSGAFRRGVDVLCFVDEPSNEPAVDGASRPIGDRAEFENYLRRVEGPTQVAFRRKPLIEAGLFRCEDGESYLQEALLRLWRRAYRFGALCPSEPSRILQPVQPNVAPRRFTDRQRPVRVVYFVNGTDVRGGIRIVFEQCNRLRDRGIDAIVASFGEPLQEWFPDLRAPIIRAHDAPTTDVAVATFWTTADFVSELDCERYYFIQHDEALFEQDDDWAREVRRTYQLPLEFITISTWLVELIKTAAGRDAVLVPNGINSEMFYPDPAFERGPRIRVLVEGNRDIFWKGMEEAKAVLEGLDAEVWTLGNTGIDADRSFINPPQHQLRRIYSSCDILLKTSWYEGMPLPHMEAMACGCALITTDVPGVRDYCVDGWNCLMTEPRNIPAMRGALLRLMGHDELRKTLVANGLTTTNTRFGWDDKIDVLASVYTEAAARARSRFAASHPRTAIESKEGLGRKHARP